MPGPAMRSSAANAVVEDQQVSGAVRSDSWRVKLGMIVGGLLLSLLVIEGLVRAFEPSLHTRAWSYRIPEWYLPEGTQDRRNAPYSPEKPADVFRIIVVGDSFTFGGKAQYYDSFPKRLETTLNLNKMQRRVEVINWGVPGLSTRQEVPLIRAAMRRYHADMVILEITLNDPELVRYKPIIPYQDKKNGTIHVHGKIFEYWHSLALVVSRYYNTVLAKEYVQFIVDLYERPNTWSSFTQAIDTVAQLRENTGVPVFAAVFPLFSHPFDAQYPFRKYHRMIDDKLSQVHIPYVDLLREYRGVPPLYLQVSPGNDPHPNEIAHRMAADGIYRGLRKAHMLPDDVIVKKVEKHGRHPTKLPPRA